MADRYLAEDNSILQLEDASGYYVIDKQPVRLSPSANIADSAATSTTQRLSGGTGSFTAGKISDDTNPLPSIDVGSDGNTEVEFSFLLDDTLGDGEQYDLRITSAGTALSSYTNTPRVTIGVIPPEDHNSRRLYLSKRPRPGTGPYSVGRYYRPHRAHRGLAAVAPPHATSGALASDAATAAGTATHLTLHSTSGALSAAASTIAGTAAHHHATAGEINAAAATMAGTAAHLTLHTTSGAISAQASTIAGTAAHEHASSGALSAQDATISGAAAQSHDATGALVADAATLAGTAVHLTLHASSGALAAQDAAIAGSAAHQHATAGALAAADAAIAGTATRETPAGTHDASGALASDAATLAGTTAHLTLHVASGALAAQAAAVAGSAAHEHAASGVLAAGAATIAGTAAHFVLHATSGALAADSAAFAGAAAHEHAGTGALAAGTAAVAGTAAHTAPGVHATSGALQADAASVSGEAQILALFSRVHGFEMGGEAAKPKRRNLVTILADDKPKAEPSRKTITKRDVDRRVFEKARDEARTVIETAAKAHAATTHPKAQRFAEVRTALKPLAKALGDWNWIAVYQRMYEDAINAALREEMAREDARIVAEQEADERELMKLVMEWM